MGFDVREYAKKRKHENTSNGATGGFNVRGLAALDSFTKEYGAWEKSTNDFITNHNKRYFNGDGTYNDAYRADTSEWYQQVASQQAEIDSKRKELLGYLEDMRGAVADDVWSSYRDILSSDLSDLVEIARNDNDIMSQYSSADEYDYARMSYQERDAHLKEKRNENFDRIGEIGLQLADPSLSPSERRTLQVTKEKLEAENAEYTDRLRYNSDAQLSIADLEKQRDAAETADDKLYYMSLISQKDLLGVAEILGDTKMTGENVSVLDAMNGLAKIEDKTDQKQRREEIKARMADVGIDFDRYYSRITGESNVTAEKFFKWLGAAAKGGLDSWAAGVTGTVDKIIGEPLESLFMAESSPIGDVADFFSDVQKYNSYDVDYYADVMGGGTGFRNAGEFIQGVTGAIPDFALAWMTGGLSKGTSLTTQAARATGGSLTKTGITVQNMVKNPSFWSSFARTYSMDYEEAIALGASDPVAAFGSVISSLINAGIEIGLDGDSGIQGLTQSVKNGEKRALYAWIESSLQEGGEEILQGFVNNAVAKALYDSEVELVDAGQMLKEGLIGTGVGALLGGGQVALTAPVNKAAERYQSGMEELGSRVDDDVIAQLREIAASMDQNSQAYLKVQQLDSDSSALFKGETFSQVIREIYGNQSTSVVKEILLENGASEVEAKSLATEFLTASEKGHMSGKVKKAVQANPKLMGAWRTLTNSTERDVAYRLREAGLSAKESTALASEMIAAVRENKVSPTVANAVSASVAVKEVYDYLQKQVKFFGISEKFIPNSENKKALQKIDRTIKSKSVTRQISSKDAPVNKPVAERAFKAEKSAAETGSGVVKLAFGVKWSDIKDYVRKALTKENTQAYKKYATVSERLAGDIGEEVNLTGYSHALRDNDIRHIFNSHGENTNEKYPVTAEDIENIPYIVENYDKVYTVKRSDGRTGLIYVKATADNLVYYLEQVTEKYGGEKLLVNKQMVKTGIGDIPGLPGLKEAITKKQTEDEFLNDLQQAQQVYVQNVSHPRSINSITDPGENVNTAGVAQIASITDGVMTLELTDGSRVGAAEYAFASEDEALVYESVLHMGANAATANALVQQYRQGNVAANAYVRGIAEAYTYGLYGLAESEMSPTTFTADLSAEQRHTAYRLGQTDAKAAVEAEQARIDNLKRAVVQAKSTGEVYNEDGTVLEESDSLTEIQKASIRALKSLAKALKLDFYVYESYEREVDETGAPIKTDVKESSRGIAKRSKTSYNEFASLAMRWANKADRQSGDATIIYDAKRKRHVIIEALEKGYFEVASGTYEEMRDLYERVYAQQNRGLYGSLDRARSKQGPGMWDLQLSEDRGNDVGDVGSFRGEGLQTDTAGNDEHLRGGHQGESAKYSGRDVITERVWKTPDGTIEKAPNGFFVGSDNKIHVDLNAGLEGKGTMLYTVSHELGHFIKKWSPKKFKALADFLAKTYGKHGWSVRKLVEEQQDKAKRNGREISFDEAYEEFVCDSLARMLTDGDAAAKIQALQKYDASIVAKIKEFFADLASKLKAVRNAYKDTDPGSAEGRFIRESLAEFDRLQQLFAEALVDAADAYNATEQTKNTAEDGGVKYSIKNTSSMSLQEQMKRYRNGEMASSDAFYFGKTPSSIGESGLREIPLVFTQSDYKKSHSTKHSVPFRLIKSLNSLLENSLFSFDADGRYGFLTEEIDADGKPLLIAVEANVQMDWKPVNAIRSVYGLDDPAVWIKNQVETGKKFVAYNKNETDHFLRTYGYLASVNGNVESLRDRVPQSSENVKEKLSDRDNIEDGGVKYDSRSFSEQVDSVLNGEDTTSTHLRLTDETPSLLQEAGLPKLPILMTAKHLKSIIAVNGKKNSNYHGLSVEIVKKLPQYIADPVMLADSLSREDSVVIITETVDSNDRPVIAAILLDGKGRLSGKHINANIMTSAYGKDNFQSFLNRLADNNAVFYWHQKKSQDLSVSLGLQLPNAITSLDPNVIIRKAKASVKVKLSDRDTAGRRLTAEQQEFFKDSKVRDENGNLIALYHGTENGGFTVFDPAKADDGISLFFTDDIKVAETYSGTDDDVALPAAKPPTLRWTEGNTKRGKQQVGVYEVYLNLKNPLVIECEGKTWGSIPYRGGTPVDLSYHIKHGEIVFSVKAKGQATQTVRFADNANTEAEVRKFLTKTFNKEIGKQYSELFALVREDDADYGWKDSFERTVAFPFSWDFSNNTLIPTSTRGIAAWAKKEGYDGVIFRDLHDYGGHEVKGVSYASKKTTNIYVAFDSNAIKDVDNKTPTANKDIRYSFRDTKSGMANDALTPYNNELAAFIYNRGDYIVDDFNKLTDIVDMAFDNPTHKATAYFGIIHVDTLDKIKNSIPNLPKSSKEILFKSGKDYSIAVTLDSIRHMVDEKRLSREDVIDYLDRLADTIVDFDSVHFDYYTDSRGQKQPGLLFKKRFADGALVSFDIISQKKRSVVLQSLYLDSVDYQKKKSAETSLMQNTSAHTPKAQVGQTSANSIRTIGEKVKERLSDRDYAELERRRQVDRALRAENERLQEDVGRLREVLAAQSEPANGRRFSKTAVEAAATQLMQRAGARFRGDKAELVSMLNAVYNDLASDDDLRWETVAEKAQPIVEWMLAHRPVDSAEQDYYRELTARELLADVYDSFWNATTLHAVAAEIDLLKGKHKQQMKTLRERRDAKIKALKTEYRERIKRIREQKNAAMDREISRTRETYRHTLEKRKEATAAQEARAKLQKLVLETAKWLAYPSKTDVKCPDVLREPYAEFLSSIDLTSKRQLGGGEATHNDLRIKSAMDTLANAVDKVRVAQAPGTDVDNILDSGYLDLPVHFVAELREMADGIKADMTGDKRGRPASTAQAIETHEEVIDLSADNELSKEVEGVFGSAKYKIIQRYILRLLGNQPVTMSDGVQAVVDKSDALHIANKAANKKTAEIAQLKSIVQKATAYAEDTNVEHDKFDYFRYYKVKVKYQNEVFESYLNVGRGKNDGQYHIYDITKKLRDTADRINGLERPKPNEGYALQNGISTNSISDSDGNVKMSTIRRNMETLAAMSPVYRVPAEKLQKTGKRPSDLFREFFDSIGNRVVTSEFGEIELSNSSVRSEVRHGITGAKLASIEAIPDVLRKGKVIFEGKKANGAERIVIAAPITIDNEPYYMGAMVERDPHGQRLYLHNVVVEKEMPIQMDADSLAELGSHQNEHLNEEWPVANEGDLLTDRDLGRNEPLFISSILQKAVNVKFEHLRDTGDHYVINNMKAEDIRKVSKLIRQLNHAIRNMSKLYANARFANAKALGVDTVKFLDALGKIQKTSEAGDWLTWDNGLPVYMFDRFGDAGKSIFEELMDAQDKLAFHADAILKHKEANWTDKEVRKWSEDVHPMKLPSGVEIKLTTADAMGVYLTDKREEGRNHLYGSKTRIAGYKKGGVQYADSEVYLTPEDVAAIVESLSNRQIEVADAIQRFMSTVAAGWGNEISMKRHLVAFATDPNYYPLETVGKDRNVELPEKEQSNLYRLLNISAAKPLKPGAHNSIIIRNVFDVFTQHTSDMARMNAYGMALLDTMKWLNYRESTTDADGVSHDSGVRESMEAAYGKAAESYVLNLIKDINGRVSDSGDPTIMVKWLRMAKTANVGFNLRVAALQLTAYPRAAMVLSTASLAKGLTKVPQIQKARKYCGIALWKSFGFYDTNIARSIEDQIKGTTDIRQKIVELSLKGAEYGDAITWGALWNACEYEVAATGEFKVGSEEFNEAVAKKLREVVYRTQVVDSQLTRSQNMRQKSGMAQETYAFMSEPTVSANILMDAGFQFNLEKRRTGSAKLAWKKAGKHVCRAIAVFASTGLMVALVGALNDAWRDDDDEEYGKKFMEAFGKNVILELLPFNKVPILADMSEAALSLLGVGYFSTESMASQWLSQAVMAINAWKSVLNGNSSTTVYSALYKTVRVLSSFSGIAFSGAMREAVALWNNTAGAIDSEWKIRTSELSDAKRLSNALENGDTARARELAVEIVEEKMANGKTATEAKASVRSSMTSYWKPLFLEAYQAKDNAEMTRIRRLLKESGVYEDVIETTQNWIKSLAKK